MKRPGYREAVRWIAENDDCDWLTDEFTDDTILSVSAVMVCDLFDVDQERFCRDLERERNRQEAQGLQMATR